MNVGLCIINLIPDGVVPGWVIGEARSAILDVRKQITEVNYFIPIPWGPEHFPEFDAVQNLKPFKESEYSILFTSRNICTDSNENPFARGLNDYETGSIISFFELGPNPTTGENLLRELFKTIVMQEAGRISKLEVGCQRKNCLMREIGNFSDLCSLTEYRINNHGDPFLCHCCDFPTQPE